MIYCCEEHVELALDMIVDEYETFPVLTKISVDNLSTSCEYCQNKAYIWWRTNDSIQYVDRKCGNVDKFCGYLVCKLFVIILKRVVDCEYLGYYGWKIKREIFKARN